MIGCGDIACTQHGPAIKRYEKLHKNTLFAACCDINKQRAKDFKERFELPRYYADTDTMLDTEKPDVVSLIVPPEVTAELSCKIFAKGYPLILEKPPGMTPEETSKMIKAAKNIPNQVAFNRRYMPLVQKAMDMIKEWDCSIFDINYRMLRVNRRDTNFEATAIHGIDLVKHIAKSSYKQLNFRYNELPQYGKTVANFHLNGKMENGVIVHLDFLPMSGITIERVEINTANGLICLHLPFGAGCYDAPGKLIHFAENKEVLTVCGEGETCDNYIQSGFYNENAQFFNDVRQGNIPKDDIISGLQSVEIATLISKRQGSMQ